MGQKQSGPKNDNQPVGRTSYYELLGIDRNASEDEVKKAYRKKALELHPDRNYGDVERATELFSEIQHAHEILSDPQERAWYDSHEDAILGKASADQGHEQYERDIGLTTAEDIFRTVQNYNKNIKFSDSPSGFYGYLREFFEQLAKEEEVAAARQGIDIPDWPSFGHKEDEYDDVVKSFYAKWAGFSTCKGFEWRDHRIHKDAERAQRRYVESLNKRAREDAKAEFTQAVRSLVQFVRKRDPRVPRPKTEDEVEKAMREAVAAQKARAQRMRAENEAKFKEYVPEWVKAREPEEFEEEPQDESEEEHFECVACKKTFKSEKSWEAHEKSKKHIKTVQQLRRRLQKEGHVLDLDSESTPGTGTVTPMDKDEAGNPEPVETSTNGPTEDVEQDVQKLSLETSESRSTGTGPPAPSYGVNKDEDDDDVDEAEENEGGGNKDDDDDTEVGIDSETTTLAGDQDTQSDVPKKGKAKLKREKKAAQQPSSASAQQQCATCNASFPSRSRLFQHIKDFGHGAPKPMPTKGTKGKKK